MKNAINKHLRLNFFNLKQLLIAIAKQNLSQKYVLHKIKQYLKN